MAHDTLTICVCTHNRVNMLSILLAKLQRMTVPDGLTYDVLIIDNCSTDNTSEIASKYVARDPERFKYIYECNIGLSNARNRGLKESTAEVVGFLDDDCVPRDGWLEAILAGFAEVENVGVVGGQIKVAFLDVSPPRWLKKQLHLLYGELEIAGDKLIECKQVKDYPFGGNIFFRRELALQLGGFDRTIGRIGNQKLSGEETQLCWAVHRAGYRILVTPRSIVDHFITAERANLGYLFRLAWAEGKTPFTAGNDSPKNEGRAQLYLKLMFSYLRLLGVPFHYPPTRWNMILRAYYALSNVSMILRKLKSGG